MKVNKSTLTSMTGHMFSRDGVLQSKLIRMYDRCGCLVDAQKVFNSMTEPGILSWNSIIAAYRGHGIPRESVTLFRQMQLTGVKPNQFSFASVLPACAKIRDLEQGRQGHGRIIEGRAGTIQPNATTRHGFMIFNHS